MSQPTAATQDTAVPEITLFQDALSADLFQRLADGVRAVGSERLGANGSYTTTFWYDRDRQPTNVAEESVAALTRLADPVDACIGMEWWLGRLGFGKTLRLHFDRDLSLRKRTGESVHPLLSSVFYLNAFPSSPTLILDQTLAEDGKTRVPEKAEYGASVEAVPNHYVVFPGNLLHGVIPDGDAQPPGSDRLRLTLLVNYWHRRPLPPICQDYDGTVYRALAEA